METNYENLKRLKLAYLMTVDTFKKRGLKEGQIKLEAYFEDGSSNTFTRENGARDLISCISINDMLMDLKSGLIDSAIIELALKESETMTSNKIIQELISFADKDYKGLNKSQMTISSELDELISFYPRLSLSTIKTEKEYEKAVLKAQSSMTDSTSLLLIHALEAHKKGMLMTAKKIK